MLPDQLKLSKFNQQIEALKLEQNKIYKRLYKQIIPRLKVGTYLRLANSPHLFKVCHKRRYSPNSWDTSDPTYFKLDIKIEQISKFINFKYFDISMYNAEYTSDTITFLTNYREPTKKDKLETL